MGRGGGLVVAGSKALKLLNLLGRSVIVEIVKQVKRENIYNDI